MASAIAVATRVTDPDVVASFCSEKRGRLIWLVNDEVVRRCKNAVLEEESRLVSAIRQQRRLLVHSKQGIDVPITGCDAMPLGLQARFLGNLHEVQPRDIPTTVHGQVPVMFQRF